MRALPVVLALALSLATAADEASVLAWLRDEHLKLYGIAYADGLKEECLAELELEARAKKILHPTLKSASGVNGQIWVVGWGDASHRKYLAYVARRTAMRTAAAVKLAAFGRELAAAANAEAAARAWEVALAYDPSCKDAHEARREVLLDKHGWVPKEEAEQRRKGLLLIGGEWVVARIALARRTKWPEAWVVSGAHFEVTSNVSLEGAREVLARAEEVRHAFWRETYGLELLPQATEPMKIYYFASRADMDEHNRTAHGDRPGLKQATGFFSNEDKIGHFAPLPPNAGPLADVVRHESTHQLAYYAWPSEANPTARPHFWAWEGIATFFESVEVKDGKVLVGNPDHARVKRFRAEFAEDKHVPLADFVVLDQAGVTGKYPQCAALANFFMTADFARHREKFLAYLKVVHAGAAVAGTFEACFGQKPEELQAEWETWVRRLK